MCWVRVFSSLCSTCKCFFFKQKTAYEMRISDWSSDVCSSDLTGRSSARHKLPKATATTREVLDVQLWSTEKIKGTPHGIFSKMISSTDQEHSQQSQRREQRINFDHFNIDNGREVLLPELPKGKRTNRQSVE